MRETNYQKVYKMAIWLYFWKISANGMLGQLKE